MSEVKVSKEVFAEITKCNSPENVVEVCKNHSIEVSLEDAEKFFAQMKSEELSMESAEKVAGGEPCVGAVSFGCVGIGIA